MVLVCHVISKDHVIKRSCDFIGGSLLSVSHHPTKFGAQIWCLELKKRKYIIDSDSGHSHLNQQLGKKLKITFLSPSKKRTVNH